MKTWKLEIVFRLCRKKLVEWKRFISSCFLSSFIGGLLFYSFFILNIFEGVLLYFDHHENLVHNTWFRFFILPLYHFLVAFKKEALALWLLFSLNSLSVLNKLRNNRFLVAVNALPFAWCVFPLLYPSSLVETIFSI